MMHANTGWIIIAKNPKDLDGNFEWVPLCRGNDQPIIYRTRKAAREDAFSSDRIVRCTQVTTWEDIK